MPKDFLSLREACAHFPSRPHLNTVGRWATRGVYGVKLKTCRYGGKRLTRKAWIEEFNAKLLSSSPSFKIDGTDPATAAEDKLDAMGIA